MLTTLGILLIILGLTTIVLNTIFKTSTLLQWFTKKRSIQITFFGYCIKCNYRNLFLR